MDQEIIESYTEEQREPMSDGTKKEIARAVIVGCVTGGIGVAEIISHGAVISHWLGCHAWQLIGVGGLLALPKGWKAYQEIVDFREELEERRANRRLQDAAIARLQAGTPTRFVNPKGVTIESNMVFPPVAPREKTPPASVVTGSLVSRRRPTSEECASVVKHNSLELCFGRSLTEENTWIVDEITDNHLKIIGASRKGKSCLAAALLDQIERTHDRSVLQFALLDMEYKTSKLFEHSRHVYQVADVQAQRMIPAIGRDIKSVTYQLALLRQELDRRYALPEREQMRLLHVLIYVEELLEFKRRVRNTEFAGAIDDVTSLATRGLKVNLHLMICAQVDYADEELRDAMAQFVGDNFAFAVKPEAARAAGFLNNDLLQKNFASREPGTFVAEIVGSSGLGIAPEFDVKAKIKALVAKEEELPALPWGKQTTPLPDLGSVSGGLEDLSLEDEQGISGFPVQTTDTHDESSGRFVPAGEDKLLDDLQTKLFAAHYQHCNNIADALGQIKNEKGQGLGKRYYRHASWLVRTQELRRG